MAPTNMTAVTSALESPERDNAFAGSPEMQVVTDPLPLYLYDDNPWNDVRYLLHAQRPGRSASKGGSSARTRTLVAAIRMTSRGCHE